MNLTITSAPPEQYKYFLLFQLLGPQCLWVSTAQALYAGFRLYCLQKSRTFQDPRNVLPGLCRSPAMLNYRQTAVALHIYCDSTIHCKTFITSWKEIVWIAHSRNTGTSYIYLHMVFYKKGLRWTTGKFQDFPGS